MTSGRPRIKEHCCNQMEYFLEEDKVDIVYYSERRHYAICLKADTTTQMIEYCPWCGMKLPESLWSIWYETVLEIVGEGFLSADDPRLPEEFKTDEWWRKRGL